MKRFEKCPHMINNLQRKRHHNNDRFEGIPSQ